MCHAVTLPAGNFLCSNLPVGEYSLTVTASDFAPANLQRIHPGGSASTILTIVLPLQSQNIIVSVSATTQEVAQAQIEAEEKQRIIAIFPNFYTAYDPQAVPLTSRQKFSLATHDLLDPVTFLTTGVSAAIEQANNSYPTWGQGAAGYGKRYAAAYGDGLTSDLFRHAIYASLFHQDPRYYYQGTGSFSSRLLHAISYSVSLRGDDGSLHPNYSYVAGYLTSGAISNAYYPASKRGIHLVLDRAAFGVAGTAGEGFLREFIFNHLTTHRAAKP